MSRTRTRVSRALIGLLVVTITLGLISYLTNTSSSSADPLTSATQVLELPAATREPAEPVTTVAQSAPAAPAVPAQPQVLVTQTPLMRLPTAGVSEEPSEIESPAMMQPPVAPAPALVAPAPALIAPAPAPEAPAAPAMASGATGRPLVDGRARMDAGDLLAARTILNQALVNNRLSPNDAREARRLLDTINSEVILSQRRFPNDEYGGTYSVRSGDLLSRIASAHSVTWELLARLNGISDPRRLRAGQTIKVIQGPFHAVVTKSTFTMDIYLGAPGGPDALYVTSFRVGLGENDSTPAGTWLVEPQKKLRNPTYYSPRGEGIIHSGDPNNPLGTHWIGLAGLDGDAVGRTSYGIHGTIEPQSIGKMESMGCIRLLNEDVALVFDLLIEGKSKVVVRD